MIPLISLIFLYLFSIKLVGAFKFTHQNPVVLDFDKRRLHRPHHSETNRRILDRSHVRRSAKGSCLFSSGQSEYLVEIDVRYNLRSYLQYDPALERYISIDEHPRDTVNHASITSGSHVLSLNKTRNPIHQFARRINQRLFPFLQSSFLPEGVSKNYFYFMKWRIVQRFISANVHVLTTQSLLLGLGLKASMKNRAAALGVSAAVNWVLKDALGKISRMVWASHMGRKFDSDAKRWRFRSSLLFAMANYLELITYIYPKLFLLLATCANSLKQMSMLTSSATRNAIYNSFRMVDDENARENIGDIAAKGEAQIAVVDLFGIGSGVYLSKRIGIDSIQRILLVYILLQYVEMVCMYREISSVVFNVLNFERLYGIMEQLMGHIHQPCLSSVAVSMSEPGKIESRAAEDFAKVPVTRTDKMTVDDMVHVIPTPEAVAQKEKIFFPPTHLARRAIAFGSIGRAKLAPDELERLLDIFAGERYFLVVGENTKTAKKRKRREKPGMQETDALDEESIREHCHIVLHKDATNLDIVRSILALGCLRQNLAMGLQRKTHDVRSKDCFKLIESAKEKADALCPLFLKILEKKGWSTSRYMFGRVSMRAEWTIRGGDCRQLSAQPPR